MDQNPTLLSLLRQTTTTTTTTMAAATDNHHHRKRLKKHSSSTGGGLLKMFKLFPMLTTGCKMITLLATGRHHRKPLLADHATTGTLFGQRKGKIILTIQEDPHQPPAFVLELPILTSTFHKEMASDVVRITLESDTKTKKKKLMEEFVWGVFCNGRKVGYAIRRKEMGEEEMHVIKLLKGVSMGAGVLPASEKTPPSAGVDGELTYIRARFERVVGSKDSESFYMINPDGAAAGPELSIFFLRMH